MIINSAAYMLIKKGVFTFMKKILALITVLALCALALAGCGSPAANDGGNGAATEEPAAPADPGAIVIDGTEYTLPVPVAAFTENGWEMIGEEKFAEEYEPGETQVPGSTGLKKSDSDKFFITYAYNDSEAAKPLSECEISAVQFTLSVAEDTTVSIPGGITEKSTRDEILKALGNPEDSDQFEKKGYEDPDNGSLRYESNKENGYSYYFGFNDDGIVDVINVTAAVPEAE